MKITQSIFCASFLALLIIIGCNKPERYSSSIRVMSYNIKFDDKADTVNGWNQRKEQVVNLISFYKPDFIGTQEGLQHQLEYIQEGLNGMNWIGVGRADGEFEGEFSAIFYNSQHFELVGNSDSTIWLSETPSKPSKSWDAALPRILTWGKFKNKNTTEEFFVFNTHYDHIGDTARAESSKIIVETVNKIAGDFPVILTGDFNATEDSEPYTILTDSNSNLKDAYYETDLPHVGPLFSYGSFEVLGPNTGGRIDYIFVNDKPKVHKHAIVSDFRDGRYPSDHLPVIADLELN